MAKRYISPEAGDIERLWHVGSRNPWRGGEVFPNYQGPFIRAARELMEKASYKQPWSRGQRCIIPAQAFFEPNWESGKHVPWIFRRSDGLP